MSQDAVSLKMIGQDLDQQAKELSDPNKTALFDRVVFIDSTWQQCHQIITVSKLSLQCVVTSSAGKSCHYNTINDRLSTVVLILFSLLKVWHLFKIGAYRYFNFG